MATFSCARSPLCYVSGLFGRGRDYLQRPGDIPIRVHGRLPVYYPRRQVRRVKVRWIAVGRLRLGPNHRPLLALLLLLWILRVIWVGVGVWGLRAES